jgi:phosphoribosyl 1,2-cyclic phosphodiesterase
MILKLCVLASGSSGNCTFIGTEKTRILIDAGLSARKTAERLAQIGERMEDIRRTTARRFMPMPEPLK